MTRIGKILVVLISVASLAFAGFAMLIFYAGPNYPEMASQIDGYKFTLSSGENPTWSAVRARGDSQVASDKSLAKVIDAVLADKLKTIQDESTDFKNRIPPLTEELEKTKAANEADIPALTEYIAAQRTRMAALNTQLGQLQSQVLAETANAQKLENIASARRDDVFKLSGQLTEVKADKFRLEAIKRKLAEELEQVIGNIERAEARQKKLEQDIKLGMGQAG